MNNEYRKVKKTIKKLKKNHNVLFIETEYGKNTHISVDNKVLCCDGARLISSWSVEYDIYHICTDCIIYNKSKYIKNREISAKEYLVSWRCSFLTNSKKRCKNTTNSHKLRYCKNHQKSIMNILNDKLSIPTDVLKIIYNMI